MKPAPFRYHRAESVADALSWLHADDDAKPMAGGQSLMALMNFRLSRPTTIVDLKPLAELDRIFDDDGSLLIGAMCTHRRIELDELIRRTLPLLSEAARHIGHVAIRNSGTIGGSVAHADAAAEFPAVLAALGATFYVDRHGQARREIPATDFFISHFTTDLQPGDLLTWIRVPKVEQGTGWGFHEIARRHGDFASAGAVAIVRLAGGSIASARSVLFGISDRPLLHDPIEELEGVPLEDQLTLARAVDEASRRIASGLQPPDQVELKRRHARHSLRVALEQACTRWD